MKRLLIIVLLCLGAVTSMANEIKPIEAKDFSAIYTDNPFRFKEIFEQIQEALGGYVLVIGKVSTIQQIKGGARVTIYISTDPKEPTSQNPIVILVSEEDPFIGKLSKGKSVTAGCGLYTRDAMALVFNSCRIQEVGK